MGKKIVNRVCSFVLLCFFVMFTSSCASSVAGYTGPVKVNLPQVAGEMPPLSTGFMNYDKDKTYSQNTTPFKCGGARFSEKDLGNLEVSLQRGVTQITGSMGRPLAINVMVRSNMISFSNGEVAILTSIAWRLSDEGMPIFEDNFYVAKHNGATAMQTLGKAKEEVMKKIVKRILLTSSQLANGKRNLNPTTEEGIYTSFAHAVSILPANMSMGDRSAFLAKRYESDWQAFETPDPLDWNTILAAKGK